MTNKFVKGITRGLGLSGARAGETRDTSRAGGPRLVGTVEHVSEGPEHRELMMRLDQPGRGVALLGTYVWAGRVNVAISLYFYGEHAEALAAREAPAWQQWLNRECPDVPTPPSPLTSLRAV